MYIPTDEDITLMDEIISKLEMHRDVDYHGYPNNTSDTINGRILKFAINQGGIGLLIMDNQSLRCNQDTLDFVESGGFKIYFDNVKESARQEKERQARQYRIDQNVLDHYDTRKKRFWKTSLVSLGIGLILGLLTLLPKVLQQQKQLQPQNNSGSMKAIPSESTDSILLDSSRVSP
ncbi:MAG: hypothetical protein HRT58_10865 [Crocinitomicaceae bacterium]|nr:hypothetical protein [Flavobacteriales bacterium]NQZ36156.1 hypothetical protein [Crocinitomicaceae bacterium]